MQRSQISMFILIANILTFEKYNYINNVKLSLPGLGLQHHLHRGSHKHDHYCGIYEQKQLLLPMEPIVGY